MLYQQFVRVTRMQAFLEIFQMTDLLEEKGCCPILHSQSTPKSKAQEVPKDNKINTV